MFVSKLVYDKVFKLFLSSLSHSQTFKLTDFRWITISIMENCQWRYWKPLSCQIPEAIDQNNVIYNVFKPSLIITNINYSYYGLGETSFGTRHAFYWVSFRRYCVWMIVCVMCVVLLFHFKNDCAYSTHNNVLILCKLKVTKWANTTTQWSPNLWYGIVIVLALSRSCIGILQSTMLASTLLCSFTLDTIYQE